MTCPLTLTLSPGGEGIGGTRLRLPAGREPGHSGSLSLAEGEGWGEGAPRRGNEGPECIRFEYRQVGVRIVIANAGRVDIPRAPKNDGRDMMDCGSKDRLPKRISFVVSSSRLALALALALAAGAGAEEPGLDPELSFEAVPKDGQTLPGWGGGPPGTVFRDEDVVHSGTGAARLERAATSGNQFSALTRAIDIDFGGGQIELRGALKVEGVTEGAGLWMRQDGKSGSLAFVSMQSERRSLVGTADWAPFSIRFQRDAKASKLFFGVVLAGEGKAWVDDLEIRVDGQPIAEAPERVVEKTVLDTDTEFDAGSKIEIQSLTPIQIENLSLLGRVWGFLKYHHPRIAAGELHWDHALFRIMPSVLEAGDRATANRRLAEWVGSIGVPEPCEPCATSPEDVHLEAPIDWIRDRALLGEALAGRLETIWARRPAKGPRFYISQVPGVGNPVFENELAYAGPQPPDAGYRLLALYRLWNIIEYWFPYRDLLDDDWTGVLGDFVPRLATATDWDGYRLTLLALIAKVSDTHANLWSALDARPPRGDCRWPATFRFVEERFVVTAADGKHEGGFEVGDAVLSIDGRSIDDRVAAWTPYYAASNAPTRMRDIARFLSRGDCGPTRVAILRGDERIELEVDRLAGLERTPTPHDRPGDTFQRLSAPASSTLGDIGYLKLSSVEVAKVDGYLERAAGTRGLVIDIRNYPSAFVVFVLGGRLIDRNTPFARFTIGDPANPGAFLWGEPLSLSPIAAADSASRYDGKVAILVDETSISQSEYTAMALSAGPRAVVVGSTTAGADGNVSQIPLPGGLRTMISGIGVFYPDKRPTQRIGIVPDIVARPTVEGIRRGRDEVLEAAIRHLLGPDADPESIIAMARRP